MNPIDLTTPIKTRSGKEALVMGRAFVNAEWRYDLLFPDKTVLNNQPASEIAGVIGEPMNGIIRMGE